MNSALKMMLAEDDSNDVFLIQQALKKADVLIRLNAVPDGLEALAYLKGEGAYADRAACPFPDVLLLDLNMPGMNGFEVLTWVRQDARYRRLIVHVFSASSREVDVERAYDLGANSYLVKPGRLDELVALVLAMHEWHRFTALPRMADDPSALAQAH